MKKIHSQFKNIFFLFSLLFSLIVSFSAFGKQLASISYKGAKGPVKVSITLEEFVQSYKYVKQLAPTTTPTLKNFWEDYLRYRLGIEEAYNNPSLIKNTAIKNMFASSILKETFEQSLYKLHANQKLKGQVATLDRKAKKLSKKLLNKLYKKNPEYNFNFILVTVPINPSVAQLKAGLNRANSIYKDIRKSKKSFFDLIDLYSDNRMSGKISMSRTRNMIYPSVYKQIKKMKAGQISAPIRTPTGFYIVKLNRKVPFKEANRTSIKASYFDIERGKIFKNYFNGLKRKYKVQVNKSLLKQVK